MASESGLPTRRTLWVAPDGLVSLHLGPIDPEPGCAPFVIWRPTVPLTPTPLWAAGADSPSGVPARVLLDSSPRVPALRLRATVQGIPQVSSASPERRAAVYTRGLDFAMGVMGQALAARTVERQTQAAREVGLWLAEYGETDLTNCSAEDLLVYLSSHWLQQHHERGSSTEPPSANTLDNHLALLSGYFTRLGCGEVYDAATGLGNPCASPWVSDFKKGYRRIRLAGGALERSAVPLTEAKYHAVVVHLWGAAGQAARALDPLLLLRDLLCVMYMWQSTMRGHDTGKLGLGDFVDPQDINSPFTGFPLPLPNVWANYTRAVTLCVRERGTTGECLHRAPPVWLESDPTQPGLCFVRTLALYMDRCSAAGMPVRDWLFRPLRVDRRAFREEPLSSGALGARVRLHLMMSEVYAGETNHSFRRGALQHAVELGADVPALQALGQLKSPSVLSRYLDPHRHEGRDGSKRMRTESG